MFLLGRQAMLGQEPPIYFRSITAAFIPCLASVQARNLPASPLPRTRRSYPSNFDFCVVLICIPIHFTPALAVHLSLPFCSSPGRHLNLFEPRVLMDRPH